MGNYALRRRCRLHLIRLLASPKSTFSTRGRQVPPDFVGGRENIRLRCPKQHRLAVARAVSTAAQDIAPNICLSHFLWRYPTKTGSARFPDLDYLKVLAVSATGGARKRDPSLFLLASLLEKVGPL